MADKHVWIDNGTPVGQIVVARTAGEAERFAAEELSRYFEKMSGAPLPVREGTRDRETPSILLDWWDQRLPEIAPEFQKRGIRINFGHHDFHINYLAFQSIVWDDARSADEFLEMYCRGFFGDAGAEMAAMYRAWEDRCRRARHTQPSIHYFHWLFEQDTCQRSQELIERARSKTDDPKVQYRLFRLSLLVRYASRALEGSEKLQERSRAAREGKSTEGLERELLPWLQEMTRHVRSLIELGLDIYGHMAETDLMKASDLELRRTRWEQELATILEADWIRKEPDPDILQSRGGDRPT